ncbi:GTP cyclohydrolase I [Thermomicrobiaceae bacterium CFH 74404]|uniref:GTP cyclohydrolase 1 n=2 Tax=Thermomicrobia TaxID=189775 RepID=A0AA42BAQ9_9BACT|nr:GTP cyclohydrolase I [Thermalbibacter longus]MCM8750121.1 GTP cyclohydrolase I [Thermalbibacter longus]
MREIDRARLETAVRMILEAAGEDLDRPELRETPRRAAEMLRELLGGLEIDPASFLAEPLAEQHEGLVVIRDIPVRSVCEHHLVPMVGRAHVAYLPDGRIVGSDRIIKLVDALARRPQLQERLTRQIAEAIEQALRPQGVAVQLELEQMCMTIRGVQARESRVLTAVYHGAFDDDPSLRALLASW